MSSEEILQPYPPYSGPKVAVVGVGDAGNTFLAKAIGGGVSPARCVAVNNDGEQLSSSPARNKVLLSSDKFGPGKVRESALGGSFGVSAHRVGPLLDGSNLAIVLAGLGGTLGTNAGPLIAQLTRTPERVVVSMVALPYLHERERRFIALRGLKQMCRASNCTVVVDNAVDNELAVTSDRISDERAGIAVRSLVEFVSHARPETANRVIEILSLGSLATACTTRIKTRQNLQGAVMDALRKPSANLALSDARGAIMLTSSSKIIEDGEAALAYETIASLIGRDLDFTYGNVQAVAEPAVCIFLTGYEYDQALRAMVDFVDLYDVEEGQSAATRLFGLEVPLFQMERP